MFSALPAEGGALVQFARDLTAATALEALSTLLVVVLPLAFFDGQPLFAWSKWAWAGTYTAVALAFFVVIVPMGDSWGETTAPLWGWMTLFAVFAVVTLAVWAGLRFIPEREAVSQESEPVSIS